MKSPSQDRTLVGIALVLAAFFVFSFIDSGAKWLAGLGFSALHLAFMRYFPHFVISTALISRNGFNALYDHRPYIWLLILRGLMLMTATLFNFFAVRYLPLTLTSTLLFSSPILVCFLSWPMLGERVGAYRWTAIVIGFAGVVIAIRPFDDTFHWAALLSVSGALCFALYTILTRKLSGLVTTDVMQFYSGAIGTLVLLPFAVHDWQSPQTVWGWGILIMLGVFGWGGHQLLTTAYRFAPASTLTPFSYSFVVYLTVWSAILFGHIPDIWTVSGGAIIIVSGLIIWIREQNRQSANPNRRME